MSPTDPATVVACLTPPGTGALATLAVRGPRAWTVMRSLFRPASKQPLPDDSPEPGRIWFGHFGDQRLADEVVLAVKHKSPYPWLELHCHGGRQVIGWLMELLGRHGVASCSWQEFHEHVESPLRAAALEQLAQASTERTAAILLDQYHGALPQALADLRQKLQRGDDAGARARLDELLALAPLGRHLVEPWRVTIAGAPNVGKSSLANALAGYQRSVVAAAAGTTRDVVTTNLAIDGWPIELADTAGLRDADADLERVGISLARAAVAKSDLCVWVVDATAAPVFPDPALTAGGTSIILVVNKTDRPLTWAREIAVNALFVSALTGTGIPELCAEISGRLVPCPPPPGAAVPFLASLVDALNGCRERLDRGDRDQTADLLQPWC